MTSLYTHSRSIFILALSIIIIDVVAISTLFLKSWKDNINNIQKSPMQVTNFTYPIIAYILIIAGAYLFVYLNIKSDMSWLKIFAYGFLWGIIVYGIFDFTNLSLFKNYSAPVAFVDTLWGGILVGTSVLITHFLMNKPKKMIL